uniref:U8-like protein n=1 Tax=Glypta fumiferanae TaxID=389681 RepID=A0A0F6Q761_9HYME|nr:U8-like protein [Glypta fumiferanae]
MPIKRSKSATLTVRSSKQTNTLKNVDELLQTLIAQTVDERKQWATSILSQIDIYARNAPTVVKRTGFDVKYVYA